MHRYFFKGLFSRINSREQPFVDLFFSWCFNYWNVRLSYLLTVQHTKDIIWRRTCCWNIRGSQSSSLETNTQGPSMQFAEIGVSLRKAHLVSFSWETRLNVSHILEISRLLPFLLLLVTWFCKYVQDLGWFSADA